MNDRNNKKNTDRKKQVSKKIKDNKKDTHPIIGMPAFLRLQ